MVMADFYVTGEDFFEHGLDFPVTVGPIGGDEDNDGRQQNGDGRGDTAVPDGYFAGPEACFVARVGSCGRRDSRGGAFHNRALSKRKLTK